MPIDFQKKLAGLLVPVFALRRDGDLGIGDTQAVCEAVDFCRSIGVRVLQLLPVNETGGDNSPYNAVSALALDPVYVTCAPEKVPGLGADMLAQMAPQDLREKISAGPVDYKTVKPLKRKLLGVAHDEFISGDDRTKPRREFEAFKQEHASWLGDYCLFSLLLEHYSGDARWTQWNAEHADPAAARAWVASAPDREGLEKRLDFFAFVQWVAFTQWLAVRDYADQNGVQLMGDIPFGVSRYSADVWGNRPLFDLEWSGGAPPESFFKGDPFTEQWGQNWGIPLYHWEANARGQFAWWRKRVELTCRVFNHFRIDHVLGFFRIYAFPWEPERNGEFVGLSLEEAAEKTGGKLPGFREHPDEPNQLAMKNAMQGLRLLEKIRQFAGDQGVVAEDLGVVPFYVSAILEDLKIPGFTIPIFIRDEETRDFLDPVEYPQISLVTFATHDHQPMASYYKELTSRWIGPEGHDAWLDLQRLGKLLRLDFDGENSPPTEFTPEIHEAMVRLVLENHCWLAVFMITDLVGTTQRFNEPGISADSNWSQRLDTPLGQWAADPLTGPKLRQFAQWVRQSGRAGASTDTCSLQQDIAD